MIGCRRKNSSYRFVLLTIIWMILVPRIQAIEVAEGIELQDVVVTARRRPEPTQEVPSAMTVRGSEELAAAGMTDLRAASRGVPGLTLGTFSARRLTFPYVRGIGSGQNAPGVTTYIDGVPQLSYVTANQDLAGVERVEFLRGPQAALYGANSLGGVIQIVPGLPAADPSGRIMVGAGSDNLYELRLSAEGGLGSSGLLGSVAGGYVTRDGFTRNDFTGNDIDSRESTFGRAQLYWPGDASGWDARLSLMLQQDRDGGYALYDLASIRANPHRAQHDFEGYNERDLAQPVLTLRHMGEAIEFTSVTAWQGWETRDRTDLDYTPADLVRKDAHEKSSAWIQEWRVSSATDAPIELGDRVQFQWLAGVFAFREDDDRRDATSYRPAGSAFGLWPMPFEMQQEINRENTGASVFGHGSLTLDERWELGLGMRHDYQHRRSENVVLAPSGLGLPPSKLARSFDQLSPSASLSYRIVPEVLVYANIAKGYRTGGFNAIAPPNQESFDEEISVNYETGIKSAWLEKRLLLQAAAFYTDWDDIQVNTLLPGGSPSDYYIGNGGAARSTGGELEVQAYPVSWLQLFASLGLLDTSFGSDTLIGGMPASGNELPFAPRVTWQTGFSCWKPLGAGRTLFARGDVAGASRYYYDASNAESQDSHTLVNLRIGIDSGAWRLEGWASNLFDEETVPLAIPYSPDAQGNFTYIGESGPPRTLGLSLARTF